LEYIEDLHDDERGPARVINSSTGGLPILKEEVEQAMQDHKKNTNEVLGTLMQKGWNRKTSAVWQN